MRFCWVTITRITAGEQGFWRAGAFRCMAAEAPRRGCGAPASCPITALDSGDSEHRFECVRR